MTDTAVVPHRSVGRMTIRSALLLGSALTLAIWVVAGYYFSSRIAQTEQNAAAINARYMQAQDRLSTVRAQVLLESVYVRDALLDPQPVASEYRRQLQDTHEAVNRALEQYVPVLDSEGERARVDQLRREIGDFHRTMLGVLATDSTRWPTEARAILNSRVVPKRETVIRISEETQALNRNAFVQQQRQMRDVYAASQQGLWLTLGLALVGSFGVTLFAAWYSGRLEHRIRQQSDRDAQNAAEMQRLSAKLITAQEEERRSIARELHDEVGQVLTTIKVELAVAERAIEASGGRTTVLADARSATEGALATVRDLSHLLHPALLDDLGLPAAIEWYLRGFGKRHDIRAELLHEGIDGRLPPDIETSAYRIVQEALTNVAKHARATTCRVYLQRLANTVLVTVDDNGVGFEPSESRASNADAGLGLIGIRERVAQLRGTIRLETAPGKGTRLTVEFPIQTAVQEEQPASREAASLGSPVISNG